MMPLQRYITLQLLPLSLVQMSNEIFIKCTFVERFAVGFTVYFEGIN